MIIQDFVNFFLQKSIKIDTITQDVVFRRRVREDRGIRFTGKMSVQNMEDIKFILKKLNSLINSGLIMINSVLITINSLINRWLIAALNLNNKLLLNSS